MFLTYNFSTFWSKFIFFIYFYICFQNFKISTFFSFYTVFPCTQLAFVFHLLRDFCNIRIILPLFLFFFFRKILISFSSFFVYPFFIYLIIFSWWGFRHFCTCTWKEIFCIKIYKKTDFNILLLNLHDS